MIEVKNLTKKYGNKTAVDNISFKIRNGTIYGLLGPNGAGKSTTMNMLTGCLSPTEGSININGYDIYDDAIKAKSLIGYLPELPPLYYDMTPYEYLIFVAKAKKISKDLIQKQIKRVMTDTGIYDVADRLIKNLSKGYRQRVGIAQALLGNPEIIILDEPTVGLDPAQIIEIRELVRKLGKNKTVIISSHILAEISELCENVIIISKGKIVADGSLNDLVNKSPFNRYLLTVKGESQEVLNVLSSIPEIQETKVLEDNSVKDAVKIQICVKSDRDIRDRIFFTLADKRLALIEMEKITDSLEDLYISLTKTSSDNQIKFPDIDDEFYIIPKRG